MKTPNKLTFSDSTSKIKVDEEALIFGTTYKLQYIDPFLFLVYQLRRFSLDAKLLVVIGYGFGDEHINGILAQALAGATNKRLVAVTFRDSEESDGQQKFRQYVSGQLKLPTDDPRLVIEVSRARDFLEGSLTLSKISAYFPPEESIFEEAEEKT